MPHQAALNDRKLILYPRRASAAHRRQDDLYEFPYVLVCFFHTQGCGYADESTDTCVSDALQWSNVYLNGDLRENIVTESMVSSMLRERDTRHTSLVERNATLLRRGLDNQAVNGREGHSVNSGESAPPGDLPRALELFRFLLNFQGTRES